MKLCLSHYPPVWHCHKQGCKSKSGLRSMTWLENTKLPMEIIVYFVHAWCNNLTTTKFCKEQIKIATEAITDWKNFLREVCAYSLLQHPIKIGGEGMTFEIDESLFSRRKYNVGRALPVQWVLEEYAGKHASVSCMQFLIGKQKLCSLQFKNAYCPARQ